MILSGYSFVAVEVKSRNITKHLMLNPSGNQFVFVSLESQDSQENKTNCFPQDLTFSVDCKIQIVGNSNCKFRIMMRLNKYLFNRVNNKERERGQRSVVWLRRGQPYLHHLHVLSTVFLWRQFSSFSLWIILLPHPSPPLLLPPLISVTGAWFLWHEGSVVNFEF